MRIERDFGSVMTVVVALLAFTLVMAVLIFWIIEAALVPRDAKLRPLATLVLFIWVGAVGALGVVLAAEAIDLRSVEAISCPVPGNDSVSVGSHWSWVPPGIVCEYTPNVSGPSRWRTAAFVGIVALPFCFYPLWPRHPRAEVKETVEV